MRSGSLLRERLQEMTSGPEASVESHPRRVAELADQMPHSIELAPHAPCLPIDSYNCFEFALGLAGRREVRLISEHLPSTFCDGTFVQRLVDSALVPAASPSTGDLVLYRDHHHITHAGLVEAGRIVSKWGKGHLWLHGLLEVPAQYGDTTSFHEAPVPSEMLSKFIEFARAREGNELVDRILELEVEP
jgi:hypothetical protein